MKKTILMFLKLFLKITAVKYSYMLILRSTRWTLIKGTHMPPIVTMMQKGKEAYLIQNLKKFYHQCNRYKLNLDDTLRQNQTIAPKQKHSMRKRVYQSLVNTTVTNNICMTYQINQQQLDN